MSRVTLLAGLLAPFFFASLGTAQVTTPPGGQPAVKPLTTVTQQASYAIGLDFGQRLTRDGAKLDLDAIVRGLRDGLTSAKPELSDEQIDAAMEKFVTELRAKQAEVAKGVGDKNKKEGDAFLAANAQKPGVKTTKSGLQIKTLRAGSGASPKATDTVKVHYHGMLTDGTVFDSSVERKVPAEFPVNGVIAGWTEALQLMKVGEKVQLYIPPGLAYGAEGSGPIPPNSVLVFDVELLDISK